MSIVYYKSDIFISTGYGIPVIRNVRIARCRSTKLEERSYQTMSWLEGCFQSESYSGFSVDDVVKSGDPLC